MSQAMLLRLAVRRRSESSEMTVYNMRLAHESVTTLTHSVTVGAFGPHHLGFDPEYWFNFFGW